MAIDGRTAAQIKADVTAQNTTEGDFRGGLDNIIEQLDEIQIQLAELGATDAEVKADLSKLNGVTATAAELNVLDGFTGNTADLETAKDINDLGNGTNGQRLTTLGNGNYAWQTPTVYSWTLEDDDGDKVELNNGEFLQINGDSTIETNFTNTSNGTDADPFDLQISVADNSIMADHLSVSGDGSATQFLRSDADGTFTWAVPVDTTYTAGGDYGLTLSGTEFRLEDDRRRNSSTTDIFSGNTHDYTHYDADVGIRWFTAGAEEMRLENDGDLHVDGDVVAFSSTVSDKKLKKDIKPIENALEKVNQIGGYTFTYKHNDRKSAGVIAQEIEKVMPDAVSIKNMSLVDNETYKIVQYDQLHGLLVEAIKELTKRVEELENGS